MIKAAGIFNKNRSILFLLFVCSFLYYFFYFNYAFFHLNTVLAGNAGDTIKNYFTFMYQTVVDSDAIQFTGMNYPYGEHTVYTDSQPLLTWIFRLFPFTHNYLIGILHFMMFFTFIITPCIYFNIFKRFNVNTGTSFLSSLAIIILSPQLIRIGGHFGLSYACFIPLLFLMLIDQVRTPQLGRMIIISLFVLLLFFIHPYLGIGASFFALVFITISGVLMRLGWKKTFVSLFTMGFAPLFLFKLFMALTDVHEGRTDFVYGADVYISNFSCVFVSYFKGPFEHFMMQVIKVGHREWEGVAYVGFCMNILMVVFALLFMFKVKKFKFDRLVLSFFICGVIFLFMSFGWHNDFLKLIGIEIKVLNQFRANGRFAWYFYYLLPVFLIVSLDKLLNEFYPKHAMKYMFTVGVIFLVLNMIEGHSFIKFHFANAFKSRNIFRPQQLNDNEKSIVAEIKKMDPQAILPLPFYHIGSDLLERDGVESVYMSALAAYHCKVPIICVQLARTSLTETKNVLSLLNDQAGNKKFLELFNNKSVALMCLPNLRMPDEASLISKAEQTGVFGSYKLMRLSVQNFHTDPEVLKKSSLRLNAPLDSVLRKRIIFYTRESNGKLPILNQSKPELLLNLDNGTVLSGNYLVSFQYHMTKIAPKEIDCGLIVEKFDGSSMIDSVYYQIRRGYVYDSLIVFEKDFSIDSKYQYKFISKGGSATDYKIGMFLLRPDTVNVIYTDKLGKEYINNRPNP